LFFSEVFMALFGLVRWPWLIRSGWVALACLVPALASAQAWQDRVKNRGQINVGYRADAAPFSYDHQGQPTGYAIDLCRPVIDAMIKASGKADLRVRYIATPLDQALRNVAGGSLDLMCTNLTDTPARREQVAFSAPIFVDTTRALVRSGSGIKQASQLAGKKVVVIARSTSADVIRPYGEQNKLGLTLLSATDGDAALGQLKLDWAQAYVRGEVALTLQWKTAPAPADFMLLPERLQPEPLALAFPRGDAGMAALVQTVLKTLHGQGQLVRTHERWFNQPLPGRQVTMGMGVSPDLTAAWGRL
jgi:glutamate/aspartate transport system substrate-binding protein